MAVRVAVCVRMRVCVRVRVATRPVRPGAVGACRSRRWPVAVWPWPRWPGSSALACIAAVVLAARPARPAVAPVPAPCAPSEAPAAAATVVSAAHRRCIGLAGAVRAGIAAAPAAVAPAAAAAPLVLLRGRALAVVRRARLAGGVAGVVAVARLPLEGHLEPLAAHGEAAGQAEDGQKEAECQAGSVAVTAE